MNIYITRKYTAQATLGHARVCNASSIPVFDFKTLELPWKDNQVRISCIPEGKYKYIKHVSPKFGPCLWLPEVKGRSEILMHRGNYTRDTLGCILPGDNFADIDNDGIIDVTNSRNTMKKILSLCSDTGYVYIS